jgi:hypothetical protein
MVIKSRIIPPSPVVSDYLTPFITPNTENLKLFLVVLKSYFSSIYPEYPK